MLAHIRSGALVKKYNGPNVRIQCENGDTVSPIFAGYTNGNDRVVPVVPETVGTPGPDTKSTFERIIEADQVIERTTYTAMTAQEIADRDAAAKDSDANSIQDVLIKVITNHENRIRTLESRPSVTEAQVKTFLRGLLG